MAYDALPLQRRQAVDGTRLRYTATADGPAQHRSGTHRALVARSAGHAEPPPLSRNPDPWPPGRAP